ncbi:MAG: hypothetical protein RBQ97_09955 [Acholeplasma sp.]|nr:hypothetical protein [Acholeplasma sp.]
MKFEIGQKVNTPLGVGELYDNGYSFNGVISYLVRFTLPKDKNGIFHPVVEFPDYHLKPYKTADERLLEMGYECYGRIFLCKQYVNIKEDETLPLEINIDTQNKCYYIPDNDCVNLELSRILTQYLEEMEE